MLRSLKCIPNKSFNNAKEIFKLFTQFSLVFTKNIYYQHHCPSKKKCRVLSVVCNYGFVHYSCFLPSNSLSSTILFKSNSSVPLSKPPTNNSTTQLFLKMGCTSFSGGFFGYFFSTKKVTLPFDAGKSKSGLVLSIAYSYINHPHCNKTNYHNQQFLQ